MNAFKGHAFGLLVHFMWIQGNIVLDVVNKFVAIISKKVYIPESQMQL